MSLRPEAEALPQPFALPVPTDIALTGRFWRMLAPRWASDPLSGNGPARAGGRWNEPGQDALYLSETHATAIAEYQQDLPRPGTLTAYDVDATAILDFGNDVIRLGAGIDIAFLRQPWKQVRDVLHRRPSCWDLASNAAAAGWQGLRVPSVQAPGYNLVLWRWNCPNSARLHHIDPLGDLPRNQSSWGGGEIGDG